MCISSPCSRMKASLVLEPAPIQPSARRAVRRRASGGAGAEPERRVRLLHGLGLHLDAGERREVTLEVDGLLLPQRLHDADALDVACHAALLGETVGREHARVGAEAKTDGQAAPRSGGRGC